MAFKVPESKKSTDQNKFEYEIGGKDFKVLAAKYLNGFQMEALVGGDLSVIYDVFGEAKTAAGKAVRGLDTEQFMALVEAWQSDSGLKPGESAAS